MKTKGKNLALSGDFKQYIDINLKMLALMGISIDVDNKKQVRYNFLKMLPSIITNTFASIDAIFQALWIVDLFTDDKDLTVQICTNFVTTVNCISKGIRLLTTVKTLQILLSNMSIAWKQNQPNQGYYKEISSDIKRVLFINQSYQVLCCFYVVAFCLPPLQDFFLQYVEREALNYTYDFTKRMLYVRYPFEINSIPIYFAIFFEELWILLGFGVQWIACDVLFIQVATHISIQLKILNYDIECAIDQEKNEYRLKKLFINFVKRHGEILRICNLVETIFSPIIFAVMLLSSINICVNIFELREMVARNDYADAAGYSVLTIFIVFQPLLYCRFAEKISEQAQLIANAAYNCKWTAKNFKIRKYILMLIIRSQNPFRCTALGFFSIDFTRITWIFRSAMSFFMMLDATS